MTVPMFGSGPSPSVMHACAGSVCQVCHGPDPATAGPSLALASSAGEAWRHVADAWIGGLHPGAMFTSEDVTDAVGLPTGSTGKDRNNAVGAYMRSLATRRIATPVAWEAARNRTSHGAVLRVWQVVR